MNGPGLGAAPPAQHHVQLEQAVADVGDVHHAQDLGEFTVLDHQRVGPVFGLQFSHRRQNVLALDDEHRNRGGAVEVVDSMIVFDLGAGQARDREQRDRRNVRVKEPPRRVVL